MEILEKILAQLSEQDAQLKALRKENAKIIRELGELALGSALPDGLRLSPVGEKGYMEIQRDIDRAFYLEVNANFLYYWQLFHFDLTGKRLAILTTSRAEFSDALEATKAAECVEIRLHSVSGPLTVNRSTGGITTEPGGLESVPLFMGTCDFLWIPDPSLASLVLRCQGMLPQICGRAENFLFSFRTDDWPEDAVRYRLHQSGFTEIRRIPESNGAYTTRHDETQGYYVHTREHADEEPTRPLLLATKMPSASFRLVPCDGE